jgi:hypothetical protein
MPVTCARVTSSGTITPTSEAYRSSSSGEKALANAKRRRPPAWVEGTQQVPQVLVRKPFERHDPRKIEFENRGRRNKKRAQQGTDATRNTMIDPRIVTDRMIGDDLEAINRGDAVVDRQHGTAWINGRLWGYHTDTGTVFPMEGDGFVSMSAIQYYALRTIPR